MSATTTAITSPLTGTPLGTLLHNEIVTGAIANNKVPSL